MTPEQLRSALDARGLGKQIDAAAALGVNVSSVSRWLAGHHPIPDLVEVALRGIPLAGTNRARSRASRPRKSSR
jgi:hypothetical protein